MSVARIRIIMSWDVVSGKLDYRSIDWLLTPRTSLNSFGLRFAKILHSGEERILKETAQWWFSSGDMSLYLQQASLPPGAAHLTASSVLALIW
jgi:hypothetical protein